MSEKAPAEKVVRDIPHDRDERGGGVTPTVAA